MSPNNEIIMDYSIYDVRGFNKVVFVLRNDLEKDFDEIIGQRIKKKIKVEVLKSNDEWFGVNIKKIKKLLKIIYIY